jgi:glycosyltransferase involved in cell wall biosynthesis
MSTATIVIAATGSNELTKAVESALAQDHTDTRVWVVIDGPAFTNAVDTVIAPFRDRLHVLQLPENTGANGFYGHRIYAAVSHLVNTDYVLYLDQDNWFDNNHVSTQIAAIERNGWQWGHSLRKIADKHGNYLCLDDCESLGKWPIYLSNEHHLVDTSSFCIRRDVVTQIGSVWHWGWGGDRRFLSAISQHFPQWGTTGKYTLNYRLDGNPNSVNKEFFDNGNSIMYGRHNGNYPWRNDK